MTPTEKKERLSQLVSLSIKANEEELTYLFWEIVVGQMPPNFLVEFSGLMSDLETLGLDIHFQPGVEISLMPRMFNFQTDGKIH